jgi:CHASE3 domain sensor protein
MKFVKRLLALLLIVVLDALLIAVMLFVFGFIGLINGWQQRADGSQQVAEYADELIAKLSAAEK